MTWAPPSCPAPPWVVPSWPAVSGGAISGPDMLPATMERIARSHVTEMGKFGEMAIVHVQSLAKPPAPVLGLAGISDSRSEPLHTFEVRLGW